MDQLAGPASSDLTQYFSKIATPCRIGSIPVVLET